MNFLRHLLIFIIETIRPFFGPASCRFIPSCGNFACRELRNKNIIQALWSITKRILSCNPFYREKL